MLILTRKLNETIIVGEKTNITVVEIHKNYIKLGINAPKKISVLRKELIKKTKGKEIKR